MARFRRFRNFGRRMRTIVKYVRRPRRFYPRKNNTKLLLTVGVLAVAGLLFKDKIKAMFAK